MGLIRVGSMLSRLRIGMSAGAIVAGSLLVGAGAQANQSPVNSASVQASTMSAGISIQNLDNTPGSATVDYYPAGGTTPVASQVVNFPASGNVAIFPIAAPAGFTGSAVVSSDHNVTAIVNLLQSNPTAGESYDGVSVANATTSAFAPIFMQNNGGYSSSLYVQNASNSVNNITVKFIANGVVASTQTTTLQPYGSITYDASNDGLTSGKFVGSATITGSQPVAVVSNETNGTQLFSYTGGPAGGSTLYAPLLFTNNGGFSSGLSVQNADPSTTTTVSLFLNGSGTAVQTAQLAPGGSVSWYPIPSTSFGGAKFVGSGVITSSPPVALLGSVNQLNTATGQASAYTAFSSGTPSATVDFPLVMFNNAGYYTGENIQNVGASPATVDLLVNGAIVPGQTQTIQPGASYNWFNPNANVVIPGSKVSSVQAKAHDPTSKLVGVVNEITSPQQSGDTFFAYEGTNQ